MIELQDDKVYTITTLSHVLKEHGLPFSKWWIMKAEAEKLIPDPRILSKDEPRRYTGSMVKRIVSDLLEKLNNAK